MTSPPKPYIIDLKDCCIIHMRKGSKMAVWKTDSSDRIYVVDVNMEKRSPEDIAKDAAMQIVELFDQ